MAADQLDNFARVADGPVGEQEEQARVSAEHRLPQDPVERIQDVGASHVGSDLSNILTSQSQGVLGCGNKEDQNGLWVALRPILSFTSHSETMIQTTWRSLQSENIHS